MRQEWGIGGIRCWMCAGLPRTVHHSRPTPAPFLYPSCALPLPLTAPVQATQAKLVNTTMGLSTELRENKVPFAHCLPTICPLFAHHLPTVWPLFGHRLATVWHWPQVLSLERAEPNPAPPERAGGSASWHLRPACALPVPSTWVTKGKLAFATARAKGHSRGQRGEHGRDSNVWAVRWGG